MGGIFGVATTDPVLALSPLLKTMGGALRRGESEPCDSKAVPGFGGGAVAQFPRWQGVYEEDGLIVVSDAEIYNQRDLEESLGLAGAGCPGRLIAALYHKQDRDWMSKVSGTFSVAVWDPGRRRLMLVTDRFGVRPLVYAEGGNSLWFASRLRGLTRLLGIERRIKPESIFNYLFYSMVPTPHTIFAGIRKLPPGHLLLWQEGRTELLCYWDMIFREEDRPSRYFESRLREELEQAVARVLGDASGAQGIGCFLSGGTDSSTVARMLGKATGSPPRTFSIAFDVPGYNEIEYARIAARHFGAEHHEYLVTAEDTARAIETIVQTYDEPFGNSSAVPTLYCAELAKASGVELMLAGDGGNERYATHRMFALYERLPSGLRRYLIEPLLSSFPEDAAVPLVERARKYVRRASLPMPERFFSYNLLSIVATSRIFSDDFLRELPGMPALELARRYFKGASATSALNRELYCDLKFTITDNDLRKVTQMAEKAGVRVRYPLLDERLAAFSGTIPARLKVRRLALRYIFKRALQDFLPIEVIQKKKHGFGLPWSARLRTDSKLQEILRSALLDRVSLERGYFKPSFLSQLFTDTHTDPTPFSGAVAWVFMMLELWHREHLHAARVTS